MIKMWSLLLMTDGAVLVRTPSGSADKIHRPQRTAAGGGNGTLTDQQADRGNPLIVVSADSGMDPVDSNDSGADADNPLTASEKTLWGLRSISAGACFVHNSVNGVASTVVGAFTVVLLRSADQSRDAHFGH